MKIENTKVFNFDGAFRGMRNPLDSWDKSDSYFGLFEATEDFEVAAKWDETYGAQGNWLDWLHKNGILSVSKNDVAEVAFIGPADMDLADRLIAGGTEHRKFLRQIFVTMDITAPLYVWKEFDTYKISTTANSCSTMHTLAKNDSIRLDQFEIDDFDENLIIVSNEDSPEATELYEYTIGEEIEDTILPFLNNLLSKYKVTKDVRYWKELIRWLPCGWLQKRTWTGNYEILRNIYKQRCNHKLSEWRTICNEIEKLPYAKELILS